MLLDFASIITEGGLVLYHKSNIVTLPSTTTSLSTKEYEIINEFIQRAIITPNSFEGTLPTPLLSSPSSELCWERKEDENLIFLVCYPRCIPIPFIRKFLINWKSSPNPLSSFSQQWSLSEQETTTTTTTLKSGKKKKNSTNSTTTGRDWGDKIDSSVMSQLDFSSSTSSSVPPSKPLSSKSVTKIDYSNQTIKELEIRKEKLSKSSLFSFLPSFFKSSIDLSNPTSLVPLIDTMKEHLISKNIAEPVAMMICKDAMKNLLNTSSSASPSFGYFESNTKRIESLIKSSVEGSLRRILEKSRGDDLMREINDNIGNLFIICFVGVNGVGKSTSLGKIAYWLLQNRKRILIVAGDTFRAGAIEQLKQHVCNLLGFPKGTSSIPEGSDVYLFERGYGKDSSALGREALRYAKANHYDIVLFDTAGRMQDNSPLMAELNKLIQTIKPNRTIFVGEALVGSEGVDQLEKFSSSLRGEGGLPAIDGIILSKFDTIDDKVGAAITMAFVSGAPVLFVGVGQTYTDLRKLNISMVVDSILY